ncbi:MAG: hypothetical protein LWW81_03255, partial [Rhodocyclales bacterium]|nr:hypothetical protein [Rhodocyclales bacterium]
MKFKYKSLVLAMMACGLLHEAQAANGLETLDNGLPSNIGVGVFGMSRDASVVVGAVRLDPSNYRAYVFSGGTSRELAGPAGDTQVIAQSASGDGQVVVGWSSKMTSRALVWEGSGYSELPHLGTTIQSSQAYAVSDDG